MPDKPLPFRTLSMRAVCDLFQCKVLLCLTSRCLCEPRLHALFATGKNKPDVLHHLPWYNTSDVGPAIPVRLCSHWYNKRELGRTVVSGKMIVSAVSLITSTIVSNVQVISLRPTIHISYLGACWVNAVAPTQAATLLCPRCYLLTIIIRCHTSAAAGVGRSTVPYHIVSGCENVILFYWPCLPFEDVCVVCSTFECEPTLCLWI